jgi:hypothetical protein
VDIGENMKKAFIVINYLVILFISVLLIISAIRSWNLPVSLIELMLAGSLILGAYCWGKAVNLLSDEGQDQFWRIALWSKICAGQENFTQTGWRYWIGLRYSLALILLLFIIRAMLHV